MKKKPEQLTAITAWYMKRIVADPVDAMADIARVIGGGFYDFFMIDDDRLALVIADVSGKGIPSVLSMMVSRSMIGNQLLPGCDPAQALANTNNQLCDGNVSAYFVTVWLAVLQLSTGKGVVCNAGHENRACGAPMAPTVY